MRPLPSLELSTQTLLLTAHLESGWERAPWSYIVRVGVCGGGTFCIPWDTVLAIPSTPTLSWAWSVWGHVGSVLLQLSPAHDGSPPPTVTPTGPVCTGCSWWTVCKPETAACFLSHGAAHDLAFVGLGEALLPWPGEGCNHPD